MWKSSVESREGFTDAEKNAMLLSTETLEGLQITGNGRKGTKLNYELIFCCS